MKKQVFKSVLVVVLFAMVISVFALSGLLPKQKESKKSVDIKKEQVAVAKDENVNKTVNVESELPEPKEKYVEKIIKKFTWGDGKGQLGYHKGGEFEGDLSYSPTGIYLDNNGNIYISDYVNSRVLKLNNKGKTLFYKKIDDKFSWGVISVNDDKNIYVLHPGDIEIAKYNDKLKLEKIVKCKNIPISLGTPIKMKILDKNEINIINKAKLVNYKISIGNFVERENNINFFNGILVKTNNVALNLGTYLNTNNIARKSNMEQIKSILKKTKESIYSIDFTDIDNEQNLYVLLSIYSGEPYNSPIIEVIKKFDKLGNYLSNIILFENEIDISCDPYNGMNLINIDRKGNIYQLWLKKEGATLIKWITIGTK